MSNKKLTAPIFQIEFILISDYSEYKYSGLTELWKLFIWISRMPAYDNTYQLLQITHMIDRDRRARYQCNSY